MATRTATSDVFTTSILLSNLHCPSCVRTVDDTLRQYGPRVLSISTSTVTQTVTVRHRSDLEAAVLAKALYDAGFDVQSMWEQHGNQRISTFASSMLNPRQGGNRATSAFAEFSCGLLQNPAQRRAHDAAHSAYCEQCAAEESPPRDDDQARLTQQNDTPVSYDGKDVPQISIVATELLEPLKYKVVIAIHGMTCSSCVGRVAEVLGAKSYVEEVSVSLIGHNATLRIRDADKAPELVEEIEDIGYDATLDSCEALQEECLREMSTVKTMTIKIDGLHCQHCPNKIVQALGQELPGCDISEPPKMDGMMKVSYTPQPPEFTIRDILRTIDQVDPAFVSSVFQPPSLEDRARQLQKRHQLSIAVRFIITAIAAVPTLVFGVVIMSLLPESSTLRLHWMAPTIGQTPRVQWPLLVFATVVYFLAADVFHRRALKEIYLMWRPSSRVPILRRLYRFGSMDMLLSLGTTVAYIGSIVILIISSQQEEPSMSSDGIDTTTYFDAVVFLILFLLGGRLLETYGKAQTADAVSSLGKLRPSEALLATSRSESLGSSGGLVQKIPVEHLEVGDIVLVPAGGSPACDGIIHRGTTTMDQSSLTGESKPVPRMVGDAVFAGTVNTTNAIQVRITGDVGVSLLDHVLTGYFVPAIIAIAFVDWIVWLSLGASGHVPYVTVGTGGWVFWSLQFAIAVLVVACPCGIGLAAPTALFVGTGLAAKQGILVKGGGEAFQDASALDCVVFDKTGTITEGGSPEISSSHFFTNVGHDVLLGALLALESTSSHPLARAVVAFCQAGSQQVIANMHNIKEIPGKGMIGAFSVEGVVTELFIGNRAMATEYGSKLSDKALDLFEDWSREGKTVMLVGSRANHEPFTLNLMLAASDAIRPEAAGVIAALHAGGTDVWLLSGDNAMTASVVAASVGIPAHHVIAGVLPHEKADKIRHLQRSVRKTKASWLSMSRHVTAGRATVAMIGDGINDAPALAAADVSVAMGCGSDTAISTASFVLLSSDLEAVLMLAKLSRAVIRRVKFNFAWALAYNLLMLPIAAGVLFPAVSNGSHIRLDPVWASLAMALSSISVVLSSLLLKTRLPLVGFRPRAQRP
ncbi:hypothetical protein AMS68_005669 [Peltaster fructicola]|uniref:HMA domain-containing protein n=1 Tax=Peltaster fructicola TaxID=286661 RepID=A0A6H0XZF3_9PEZI|nr:hypothetical protein AMS68_005669 [Peltaster fructicola]